MCFSNPSHGRWPYSDSFGSESRKNRLHDFAEDVSFEEVKEPVIDENARAAQIAEAVLEETKEIMQKNPLSGMLVCSLFVAGADWSDDNPATKFTSETERTSAMIKAVKQIQNAAGSSVRKDLPLSMIFFHGLLQGGHMG